MKKIVLLNCVIFFLVIKIGVAQNLVPNGGFENYSICPDQTSQIYKADGWFQPCKIPGSNSVNYSSSSDYFNFCVDSAPTVAIPRNFSGYQFPRTGNGYIGIALYSYFINGNAYREYAEIKLSQTLVANKKYNLKYFVSLANNCRFSITKFDAYLSNDSLLYTSFDYFKIPVIPQMPYNGRINDTLNWVEINGNFIATGTENYLTLGNFQDGSVCDTMRVPPTPNAISYPYSYYYYEDVSLEEDTITGINEVTKVDLSIYPNPANDNLQLSSQEEIEEINLLNIYNKSLLNIKPFKTGAIFDVSQQDNGIYILQCKFKNGEMLYKKIVVQH